MKKKKIINGVEMLEYSKNKRKTKQDEEEEEKVAPLPQLTKINKTMQQR